MHSSFDLNLSLFFFFLLKLFLLLLQLRLLVVPAFSEFVGSLSGKPGSDSTLDVEGSFFSFLGPHLRRKVLFVGLDDLVISAVDVETSLFAFLAETDLHLNAHFSHHAGRLRLVLVGLHLPFELFGVIVGDLVCLGEGVVVGLAGSVISVTSEVGFGVNLFDHFNRHSFDLHNINLKLGL